LRWRANAGDARPSNLANTLCGAMLRELALYAGAKAAVATAA